MVTLAPVPETRIRPVNGAPENPEGAYVLYWMVAHRRLEWNFALDRALAHAHRLRRPLVIFEALRVDYPWASDRHHAFVLDGMREKVQRLRDSPILYYPYVEPEAGAGRGLLERLAAEAALVVTDDVPTFFLPRMLSAAGRRVRVRMEAVDANGLLPLAAVPKVYPAAYPFRRFLQKTLPHHLEVVPTSDPLGTHISRGSVAPSPEEARGIVERVRVRWPAVHDDLLARDPERIASLPVDHGVSPVPYAGGSAAGRARLREFVRDGLDRYDTDRNHPDRNACSGLSPYLHWGHLSAHEVFAAVASHEGWSLGHVADWADGKREGWWGMGASAEAFLDQLVTWRELGFSYCRQVPDHARYETLPEWARITLEAHAGDARPWCYEIEAFEAARTHDPLWNAAQRQLRGEGTIHGYLRMLWGKKILEWSAHPRVALDVMLTLNDRYAADGRDPNSVSGIFWVLGRFDRGWPERPVFGKIRSMNSEMTARKVSCERYLEIWHRDSAAH